VQEFWLRDDRFCEVIDDDGEIVWESNVIIRYLAASRGRTDLLPTEPVARARNKVRARANWCRKLIDNE